jgi:circadian clock protein KaiC
LSGNQPPLECLSTGSEAFDRILGGGLPFRSVNVIAGEPGAGKTIFALQMLFHQARLGKKCLYLTTLSEPSLKLITYMQQFSFFDASLIAKHRVVLADIGSIVRRRGLWGAVSLLVGEYTSDEIANLSEFAIADGIIRLSNQPNELRAIREVEICKLRGANYVTGGHFFEIDGAGLAFFPRVRSPDGPIDEPQMPDERAPTGAAGLDEMLGGGVPRASTTVVQGVESTYSRTAGSRSAARSMT